MITTNPPDNESEPEPEPTPCEMCGRYGCDPKHHTPGPGPTHRPDRYVDDKFLDIFRYEDRDGAFSRIVTEGLSRNDDGSGWVPITSWRDWWQRAKRAENQKLGEN